MQYITLLWFCYLRLIIAEYFSLIEILSRLIATANCRKYSNGGNQSADTEDGRELPESEKKLHAEIETLTKEVQTLKEKNNDIFVSFFFLYSDVFIRRMK